MEKKMDPNPVLALVVDWKSVYVKVCGLWSRGCCRAGSPLLKCYPYSGMYPQINLNTVLGRRWKLDMAIVYVGVAGQH